MASCSKVTTITAVIINLETIIIRIEIGVKTQDFNKVNELLG